MRTFFKYFVELTGNPAASALLKTFSQSRASKPLILPFARVFQLNLKEMGQDIKTYESLHALFTRRLHESARSVDNSTDTLVSPVDGVVSALGKISPGQTFFIKNQLYQLEKILGSKEKAEVYQNGYFFVLYLSPSHYHRIHYPVDGELRRRWALGETSFPVNRLGELWGNQPFSSNYRIITEADCEFAKVAMVKVGALNINSIELTNSARQFSKGDELGYFSFGSTVVLLLDSADTFHPMVRNGSELKMGQPLGKWT